MSETDKRFIAISAASMQHASSEGAEDKRKTVSISKNESGVIVSAHSAALIFFWQLRASCGTLVK
jgi:hypothetical protein